MNRILGKKKVVEDAQMAKDGRRWRKQKKLPEATVSHVDLSTALPSLDDFRTSLIMPNLSARFSMLREQDDPASKLGKASDDSVLQPIKRKSRLHDFDLDIRGLGDSAEATQLPKQQSRQQPLPQKQQQHNPSTRPPLASKHHDSFVSDEGTDNDSQNGSVLSRPRPGDGNNLFGGRQKVYKLQHSGFSKANGLGKVVYESDVHLSAFQKHRQREKDQASIKGASDNDSVSTSSGIINPDTPSSSNTPPQAPDLPASRKTSSSLRSDRSADSSPAPYVSQTRSSAATSVNSQPASLVPVPVPTQTQSPPPLPEQPLNGVQVGRSLTKRRLYEQGLDQHVYEQQATTLTRLNSISRQHSGSKSPPAALNINTFGSLSNDRSNPASNSRPQSPNTLHPLTTFGSMRASPSGGSTPVSIHPQSPTFFTHNDHDEYNVLAATVHPSDRGKATAMGAFNKPTQKFDEEQYLRRLQQLQPAVQAHSADLNESEPDNIVNTADNMSTDKDVAPDSSNLQQSPSQMSEHAFAVFQNAASAMRSMHSSPNLKSSASSSVQASPIIDTGDAFDRDRNAKEDGDKIDAIDSPQDRKNRYSPNIAAAPRFAMSSVTDSPLQRSPPTVFPEIQEEDEEDEMTAKEGFPKKSLKEEPQLDEKLMVPPSETQEKPQALGGLVHQHLRNMSNQSSVVTTHHRNTSSQSSVYFNTINRDPGIPDIQEDTSRTPRQTLGSEKHTNSNPWDIDDFASNYYYGDRSTKHDSTAPEDEHGIPTWQAELKSQHTRDLSSGTMQDREAFANELAARQKAIQANLKGITEVDSRGSSPLPSASGAVKALNLLKNVSSREFLPRHEQQQQQQQQQEQQLQQQTKAMRMLGISAQQESSIVDAASREVDTDAGREQSKAFTGQRARGDSESSVIGSARSPASGMTSAQLRARTNSVVSSSDKARARPGISLQANRHPEITPTGMQLPSPRRSPLVQSASPQSLKSNNAQGYFEPRTTSSGSASPNKNLLSPLTARFTGRSVSGPASRSSPASNPTSPNMTPNGSGGNTPTTHGTMSAGPSQQASNKTDPGTLKKRNVSRWEISEPTLISSTSNVETVDLPPCASLMNGSTPPPMAVNSSKPRRQRTLRLFRFGHDGASDSDQTRAVEHAAVQTPSSRVVDHLASHTASPVALLESREAPPHSAIQLSMSSPIVPQTHGQAGPKMSSEVKRLDKKSVHSPALSTTQKSSPVMTEEGMF